MSEVEFRVLGPLELKVDGRSIPLRGMKHRIVLASLLIAENRRTSICRLIDAVWGQSPPSTARKQIRNAVSDLRNILTTSGAVLTPIADGYQLDIGDASLDLQLFYERLTRARGHLGGGRSTEAIAEFRAALALWTGPMLTGIDSAALQAQVAGVNETRLSVAEECIDHELARGRHHSLISELAVWAAEYPLRERLVAQYVLALHRSGARARAFAVYQQMRRRLAELLGLNPGPELLDVHQLMLREDAEAAVPPVDPSATAPAPPAPVPDSLPPDLAHFTGRTDEVAVLLADEAGISGQRLLAIDGMAGVGKTALAVHTAHRLAARYPDGRFFLDLQGHSSHQAPLSHRAALRKLVLLSGLPEADIPDCCDELMLLWRHRTAGRQVLLVLDNASSVEQIRPLLTVGDTGLTMVTSRRRLTMTALSPTQVLSLSPLPRDQGDALFRRLVYDRHPTPAPATVEAVLEHCGDLPLAISAAAARLRRRPTWPVGHLAARLADPALRLAELQTEDGGLTACFDSSYRQLAAEHRRLLRLLAAAPVDQTSAVAAAALMGLSLADAEQVLEELVDEHLLIQPGPGRYRMHVLVKTYCARLTEPEWGDKPRQPLHGVPAQSLTA